MSAKKKMAPAQKAAARWADEPNVSVEVLEKPEEANASPNSKTSPFSAYLTPQYLVIAIALIAVVAAFSYISMGGM